jgi:hypothetical protein
VKPRETKANLKNKAISPLFFWKLWFQAKPRLENSGISTLFYMTI